MLNPLLRQILDQNGPIRPAIRTTFHMYKFICTNTYGDKSGHILFDTNTYICICISFVHISVHTNLCKMLYKCKKPGFLMTMSDIDLPLKVKFMDSVHRFVFEGNYEQLLQSVRPKFLVSRKIRKIFTFYTTKTT